MDFDRNNGNTMTFLNDIVEMKMAVPQNLLQNCLYAPENVEMRYDAVPRAS